MKIYTVSLFHRATINKSQLSQMKRWMLRVTANVLQTKVDTPCDQLAKSKPT